MSQYGFKSKTPVNVDELLNWEGTNLSVTPAAAAEFEEELIEDVEEPDLSPSETTDIIKTVKEVEPATNTPSVKPLSSSTSDSPNFFEVGLSSLAMELYVGKSTKCKKINHEDMKQAGTSVSQISSSIADAGADVLQIPQPSTAASLICDESMYAASPVLRLSSKLTKQPDLSNVSTTDTADITPGLPSRKKANTEVHPLTNTTAATPNLSVLHWQQSSTASPDLPSVRLPVRSGQSTPHLPRIAPASCDTPELPDLQTVDIRKLLAGSSLPASSSSATARDNTPEEPQLTCQLSTQSSYPITSSNTGRSTPDLALSQ